MRSISITFWGWMNSIVTILKVLANPMDRMIIQEGLISFDVDDFTQLYQAQQNKPYYVPLREELLKYADDDYYEQTAELIALRNHLRKKHRLSKEKATDIADEMQLISYGGCNRFTAGS